MTTTSVTTSVPHKHSSIIIHWLSASYARIYSKRHNLLTCMRTTRSFYHIYVQSKLGIELKICCCQVKHRCIPLISRTCLQTIIKIFEEFDYTSLGIWWNTMLALLRWRRKRGLPHGHILIWLVDKVCPEEIDKFISAEIPDPNVDQELFDIVTTNMAHGPCGTLNMSPCMDNGKCTKSFPKPCQTNTIANI